MSELQRREAAALKDLTAEINVEHRACEAAAATAIEHAIRCGELLLKAKQSKKHGGWMRWLAENFEGSQDLANKYMRVARNSERVMNLAHEGRSVSLGGALHELKTADREKRQLEAARRRDMQAERMRELEQEALRQARTGELSAPLQMVISHTYDFEERPEGLEGLVEPLLCRVGRPISGQGRGQVVGVVVDQPDWSAEGRLWHIWSALTLEPGDEDLVARLCRHPGEVDLSVTEVNEDLECESLDTPPTRALSWDGERLRLPTGHWRAVLVRDKPWVWWEWDNMPGAEILAAVDKHGYRAQWLETHSLLREFQREGAWAGRSLDSAGLEAALAADLAAVRAHRQAEPADLADARTAYEIGERVLGEWDKRKPWWRRFAAFVQNGEAA